MSFKRKPYRNLWEKYMKDRFTKLYNVPFNPNVHKLRDSGDVHSAQRDYEGVGVDYRTFVIKYRTSGVLPVPIKLESLEDEI